MQVREMKFKYQGKTESIFRVFDASGELRRVFDNRAEAEAWAAAQ